MSQHSERTQHGPSVGSILVGVVLTFASGMGVAYVLSGEVTGQELVGSILGTGLTLLLASQTLGRHADRLVAIDRQRRAQERVDQEVIQERIRRARDTGTWQGAHIGQVLTVRWEPLSRTYMVQGWISDHWQQREERAWADLETLAQTLEELEASGEMRPLDDEGTRAVRARLDLPGWEEPVATQPMEPDPLMAEHWASGGEAPTQVIRLSEAGLPRRPVGETLRPIDTAVFRTEADRSAWMTDPTETIPRQS